MYLSRITQKNVAPYHRGKTSDSYFDILNNDMLSKDFYSNIMINHRNAGAKRPAYPTRMDGNVAIDKITARILQGLSVPSIH